MEEEEEGEVMGRPHVLVFPFPAQGHINPLIQLSQHLASSHGFLITFVNTEHNHDRILSSNSSSPLPYPNITMVGLPDGLPLDDHTRTADLKKLMQSMEVHMLPLLEQLILDINQGDRPITCIIVDAFCHWMHAIAERTGITSVIGLFPSSAAQFSLMYYIPLLLSTGQVKPDGSIPESKEIITSIPGLPDISVTNLTWNLGNAEANEYIFNHLRTNAKHVNKFDAILFNSYDDLEHEAINALLEDNVRVKPIGPLVLLESYIEECNIAQSNLWEEERECLTWLDDKPQSSVVYIAFGSIAIFSIEELHELALGLEASEQAFLWVLRPDLMNGMPANLPEGFIERTKHRSFFTSWAPQPLVLSHPSIGAFVTHCGWNSTMEGISMGVPMLTWPYYGDQRENCQFILEEWKNGLPLQTIGKPADRKEVEKAIRFLMSDDGVLIKERAANLKEKAIYAINKDGGASFKNLQEVVKHIKSSSSHPTSNIIISMSNT
ncbi:hypothetical protein GOP47_0009113 [Adiantum capillus-veneris]|uniref:Glycosyltransferase n=1 Tax=Adiantum capillus-veneris TaxID=13818 RepID=A0A9D4ZIN5_ADICA|nr:hypothetical protein GOP47_0009113 [Adiantum capillus-veneris]